MQYPIFQVDAFSDRIFGGNPAAVCPLTSWLPVQAMQQIAMENNLSETAFFVEAGDRYEIRWFTPITEVDLCGHATLAAAHVLFHHYKLAGDQISFYSHASGDLPVRREKNLLWLDFPSDQLHIDEEINLCYLEKWLGIAPKTAYRGKTDVMLVFENEDQIAEMQPDFQALSLVDTRGIIVTAPGRETDFVSRFFAPRCGIPEDPVTGSAHTSLIPFWAKKTGLHKLTARQLSARGGILYCRYAGARCHIGGMARTYLTGTIAIDDPVQ
ncbi:MAG: PhzF family phenazine biosynthesis protein [Cyclobacteriaceae bacterium]|nr:PhzF family phenazine biosynthesis protein [Cyclobacteriaceae bacterium]